MFRASGRRVAVAGALALALTGLSAPTASAGSYERIDVRYGYVEFEPDGNRLTAGDIWPDDTGVRARLSWKEPDGVESASVTDGSEGYASSENLDIEDGTTVLLHLCFTRNGADVNCTDGQQAEA
jgi:hypothetical protein